MRRIVALAALAAATCLVIAGAAEASEDCNLAEEVCERACLNLSAESNEAEVAACYLACDAEAQACSAAAQ